jgi:hypothetical protein
MIIAAPDGAKHPGWVLEYTSLWRYWNYMKTIQEYLNDPRLLNDPQMAGALEPVKEIHAVRLKIQDETAGMTAAEWVKFYNEKAKSSLVRHGLSPRLVRFTGQGKLQPRTGKETPARF